jgi:hypothetical protein
VISPKETLTKAEMLKKRKVSPKKTSSRKKSQANKMQSKDVLIVDDIDLIIAAIENTSEDILQQNEAKQEIMYDRIEARDERGTTSPLFESCSIYYAVSIKRCRIGR